MKSKAKLTRAERRLVQRALREQYRKMGKRGGYKRAANMTAEARRAQAQKAVNARWARARAQQNILDN